jgi:hypothetical protein
MTCIVAYIAIFHVYLFVNEYKMAKKNVLTPEPLLISKVLLFLFIIMSPFINFANLQFLNILPVKILAVIALLLVCFVDFQLALIGTIAFLVLIINLNNYMLVDIKKTMDTFVNADNKNDELQSYFTKPTFNLPKDIDMSKNFVCQNTNKNDMNQDMLTYYIDDKIKPYDVFISMLTNEENLNKAQGVM